MSRKQRQIARSRASARKRRSQRILLAGVAAIVAVAVLVFAGNLLRDSNEVTTSLVSQQDGRVLGSPDAPVTIEVWEDFQCPVCKAANGSMVGRLIEEYVDTGKVQLHFRHFAFLGQESKWSAEAAEAAAEQGRFWQYHDALFAAQAAENSGVFTRDRLKTIAEGAGIEMTAFSAALDSGKYAPVVEDELATGRDLGVKGTPTFFVGDSLVLDWRDYQQVSAMIEHQLAQ